VTYDGSVNNAIAVNTTSLHGRGEVLEDHVRVGGAPAGELEGGTLVETLGTTARW
jgi:hypothetical protein